MSSQGANTTVLSQSPLDPDISVPLYPFNPLSLRDSSDYTRLKKERVIYADPKQQTITDPKNPSDKTGLAYEKYGSEFRLTFLNGRFKCTSCPANAFSGNGVRSISNI
jgi:hypothetical protein